MVCVGIDWAEAHHDVCIVNDVGGVLKSFRIPDTLEGTRQLHESIAEFAHVPEDVIIGIETSQGLLARAIIASEYQVYVINPFSASRYRDRHTPSKAKSDPGDATMLAHLVRTDRQNHRRYVPNSELSEAVKVLARTHQSLIWDRQQQVNHLRSMLRLFYPAAREAFDTNPGSRDALAILGAAPTPGRGKRLSVARIRTVLETAGRSRSLDVKARQIATILHSGV